MIKTRTTCLSRLRQGDIYEKITHIESVQEDRGILTIEKIQFPHIIVLSQDCDLQQDSIFRKKSNTNPPKTQDKQLISVLVAPIYNIEHFKTGEHLSELGLKMQEIPWTARSRPTTEAKKIMNNDNPRYHYLEFSRRIPIQNSIIDFKHYFTVNAAQLNNVRPTNFICNIAPVYREHICQRFSNYLSRIGLP